MQENSLAVRVYPTDQPNGSTKAFASARVNDMVAIRGVRIVEGKDGLFVSMPQSQDKDSNYKDVAFPLSGDLRNRITQAVLREYSTVINASLGSRLADAATKAAVTSTDKPKAASKTRAEAMAL